MPMSSIYLAFELIFVVFLLVVTLRTRPQRGWSGLRVPGTVACPVTRHVLARAVRLAPSRWAS
jgi:hypothetical protein